MQTKTEGQVFIFAGLGQQFFPNTTEDDAAIIAVATFDGAGDFIPLDLSEKKIVNGELVFKTAEDLAAEKLVECNVLKTQYEADRLAALSSPELTIWHDSTLSQVDKDKINAVRQQWYAMSEQANYPFGFIPPVLDSDIGSK